MGRFCTFFILSIFQQVSFRKLLAYIRQQEMSPFSNVCYTHPLAQAPPTTQVLQETWTLLFVATG